MPGPAIRRPDRLDDAALAGPAALRVAEDRHGIAGTVHPVGAIPGHALLPQGGVCATVPFYRELGNGS